MTAQLNESLAIFMGWHLEPTLGYYYSIEPDGLQYVQCWDPRHLDSEDRDNIWVPDVDLNQASLVIKKLGEMEYNAETGFCPVDEFINALNNQDHFPTKYQDIFDMITASPQALCQAAYKVIKGGEAL